MSNIRGLRDLAADHHHGDSGGESDGEQQEFYVGGSEHSGQQVLGPPAARGNDNLTERVFEEARRNGAEGMDPEVLRRERDGRNSQFPGGGARLDSSAPVAAAVAQDDEDEPTDVIVTLNMYDNGFSIDDGPLRLMTDEASRPVIMAITQGRIPPEIVAMHPGRTIDLRMVRKGEYVPPKPKPFQGSGARLGAVVPEVVGASSSAASAPAAPVVENQGPSMLEAAQAGVGLDVGTPVTQIQVRLNNGQRLVGKFNHSHTVAAVRNFIVAAQPDLAFAPFQLMTTFPNKVVEDETLSLKDANLLNAVVVVKPIA